MNLRNVALSGLGLWIILSMLGLSTQAQSYPNPSSQTSTLKHNQSSSLGGPITPTQTDLFSGSSTPLLQPITLEEESSTSFFNFKPARSTSKRPAAPFVDDPPRPSGIGIINVKTD